MKKIVIGVIGTLGDLHPAMGIAEEFMRRGCKVILCSSEVYRPYVESSGIEFESIPPNLDFDDKELAKLFLKEDDGYRLFFKRYVLPHMNESVKSFIRVAKDADYLLSFTMTYFVPVTAKILNKPWGSTLLSPLGLSTQYNVKAQENDNKENYEISGIDNKKSFIFCMWPEWFCEKKYYWPTNLNFMNFVFYDQHRCADEQEKVTVFLKNNKKPVVVFALGSLTIADSENYLDCFMKVAQNKEFVSIILAGKNNKINLEKSMVNGIVLEYLPYNFIVNKADVLVHQGGIGSTAYGLKDNIIQIFIPSGLDREDNAINSKRLVNSGILNIESMSANKLTEKIKAMLSKSNDSDGSKVSEKIRSVKGEALLVDKVLDFLN